MNSLFNNTYSQPQNNKMSAAQVISMVKSSGKTPEQIVRGMLENGTLSQEQFAAYRNIANKTLGTNL